MAYRIDLEQFRNNLTSLVKARGKLNYAEIMAATGIPRPTLYRYMHYDRVPDINSVAALAKYFCVSVDWLIGQSSDPRGVLPDEARDLVELYGIASPSDRDVIQAILSKYKKG